MVSPETHSRTVAPSGVQSARQSVPASVQSAEQHLVQSGRLEPEIWEDLTDPAIDALRVRRLHDHEFGLELDAVDPTGMVP